MTSTTEALEAFADTFGVTLMHHAQATLTPELRELHRAILTSFVDTGVAPTTAWVGDAATRLGLDPDQALADLADADLVHLAHGVVTVAYPFSGTRTPHRVQLVDGPAVWAMCAGDALGIPPMTGRDATITSVDPHTSQPIEVSWTDGRWIWAPDTAVVLLAATTGCGTAAEAACRHIDFFATADNAAAHLRDHPALTGEIYDQTAAVDAGRIIFGSLLTGARDD